MSDYADIKNDDGSVQRMHIADIISFADFSEKVEGVELTNRQMFARLLAMNDTEREKWFGMVRDASAAGMRCHMNDHDGMVDHYGMAMAAASVQQEEAETYYKRMRTALKIAHSWRAAARMAGREAERLKRLLDAR